MEPWNADPAGYWLPRLYLLILNIHRDRDDHPDPFDVEDIMPEPGRDPLEPARNLEAKLDRM